MQIPHGFNLLTNFREKRQKARRYKARLSNVNDKALDAKGKV